MEWLRELADPFSYSSFGCDCGKADCKGGGDGLRYVCRVCEFDFNPACFGSGFGSSLLADEAEALQHSLCREQATRKTNLAITL
eukprot:SAG11_NODE_7531_length_1134_cov_1.146860_2_plen_83_part_01